MTTPFQQSGVKVLKKCKECGIYPSIHTKIKNATEIREFQCAKCGKFTISWNPTTEENGFHSAQLKWNKANGLDESNPDTWHDNHCEEHSYLTIPGFPSEPKGPCRKCGFRPIKIEGKNERLD